MYVTPRPVKRRLVFDTPATVVSTKRSRFASTATTAARRFNKRFPRGPRTRGTLYQQVKSLQKVVRDILPELKNASIDLAQTNITSSGAITHLTAISQNTTEVTRIGEDITVTKISIRGALSGQANIDPVTNNVPFYYRFFIVRDKQQVNDTVPAISDIFSSSNPVLALPSVSFADRFQFLWLSPVVSNQQYQTGTRTLIANHDWFGTIKVGYNGTASTDIQKNGIYFGILTSDTGSVVDFTGSARVVFTDS